MKDNKETFFRFFIMHLSVLLEKSDNWYIKEHIAEDTKYISLSHYINNTMDNVIIKMTINPFINQLSTCKLLMSQKTYCYREVHLTEDEERELLKLSIRYYIKRKKRAIKIARQNSQSVQKEEQHELISILDDLLLQEIRDQSY